ncbi:hypothetical protein [Novosphingobium sp. HII-3]|uniref:hypothetical protein n=1 Tax=Novosphingobium sp. HII-3 TaxID=2075565 RepID=UPI000CDB075F|nr:hypothetical protein [Novosphingobium sp. HII-3]
MSLRYSASTGGFYETQVHSQIPDDAVFVPRAAHAALMEAQAAGGRIVPSPETGLPVIEAPSESAAALEARIVAAVKREAERRILAVSPVWRQLNDVRELSPEATERFQMIDAIRAASDAMEAEIAALSAQDLADYAVVENPRWPVSEEII